MAETLGEDVAAHEEGVRVTDVGPESPLAQTLRDLGEPCVGALVDMGYLAGERRAFLVLRPDGEEPLDEVEHGFLLRLAQDVCDIYRGEAERAQDKRISQALQRGMRNELQKVEGLTAQGLYSSATAAAFVGGDFYDLIRLPDRRACVIMGDVSGKGVEAASVSAAVKTALGAYAWEGLTPARMVRSLNDFLLGFSRLETFATLFVGIIDLRAATITYCAAGHPPALLVRAGAVEYSVLEGAAEDVAAAETSREEALERGLACEEAARGYNIDLGDFLVAANELAELRRRIRRARGSVDFDTAEIRALLDEDGVPVQIVARERSCATSLIEEAMLLANECVAEWLADRDIEACYRVHEDPSPASLHGAAVALAQLGIIDDRRAAGIALGSPDELQAAVDAAAGTANAPLVNTLLLRSMQRALYKPRNEGHFALAAPCYCHFTSPIRRYPDLVVHRVLKLQLAYEQLGGKDALVRTPRLIGKGRESLPRILPQICRACSDAERAADAASHATQKIKIAQYYEDRLGERYAGTVSWVSSMGLFVRLDLTQVEGLVSIKSLGNEWFEFDEDALTLTGADTGTRYELGQRVIIEVSRVNTTRGHLDFKLIH